MSTTIPTISETTAGPQRRLWIPLSLRLFLSMFAPLFVASTLWVGVRGYRQAVATREVERLGGRVEVVVAGPKWLRDLVGQDRLRILDELVEGVTFPNEMAIFDRGTTGTFGMFSKLRTDRPIVDDATLACVAKLPYLKRLNLRWTNVGDAGMEHVCKLAALEELELVGADVSDASALQLVRLRNLKKLDVSLTLMTSSGVDTLQAALPGCSVKYRRRPTPAEYTRALNPNLDIKDLNSR